VTPPSRTKHQVAFHRLGDVAEAELEWLRRQQLDRNVLASRTAVIERAIHALYAHETAQAGEAEAS
jgi:hypothetical protein